MFRGRKEGRYLSVEADVSVLVVMSPNTVATDLDNEMVSWENIGKEKTEGDKERRQTLAWLQAQWH